MGDLIIRSLKHEDIPDILKAFKEAFANYTIAVNLTRELFIKKFVEKLQMDFKRSAGAFSGDNLVGFIFTSIHEYQNKLTAYNGGTGVVPDFRGRGLTAKMYGHLIPMLKENGVEQCSLEVITVNKSAINTYQKIGFNETRFFRCYKLINETPFNIKHEVTVKKVEIPAWKKYQVFRQCEPSFLDQDILINHNLQNETIIEAYKDQRCIGYGVYQAEYGRIGQLAVHPEYRKKQVGSALIKFMCEDSKNKNLSVLNIDENCPGLINFFRKLGFINEINQYEMILGL